MAVKILAFAGSTRTDSFNKKLIRIGADGTQHRFDYAGTSKARDDW